MISDSAIPEIAAAWLCGISEQRQGHATNVTFLDIQFSIGWPATMSHLARDRRMRD